MSHKMRVATILVYAIAAVLGNDIEIEIELNALECATDELIETFYPHKYCDMFYQCSNGFAIERQCSGNLMFDKVKLQCDWPYKVDCSGRNISEPKPEQNESAENESNEGGNNDTCNCDPAEAPEICAKPDSGGVLIAHEYCNEFYTCANQVPISLKCPKKLCFNAYKGWCDWCENVECGNKTMSENDDEDTDGNGDDNDIEEIPDPVDNKHMDAAKVCAQEGSDGVLVPHEYCNMFYICVDKQPVGQRCSGNLTYNPVTERCDWPSNVNCGNKTNAELVNNDNGSDEGNNDIEEIPDPVDNKHMDAAKVCAQEGSDGVLVPHEYCNMFYICVDKQPVGQRCSGNLTYNPVTERCDWPSNVNCGNKTNAELVNNDNGSDEGNNDIEEIPDPVDNKHMDAAKVCAQEGSDGVLVPHEYCNMFYICVDKQPFGQRCSGNLTYNPVTERCDWPSNVNCGNKTNAELVNNDNGSDEGNNDIEEIPDPVDNKHMDAAKVCAQEGSDGVLVPHEHCNMFYICVDKQPVGQRCSGNLTYNPVTERCDWPSNVNCGNKTNAELVNNDNGSDEDNNENDDNDNIEGPINNNPAEAQAICAQDESDGILIAHENCDQFYICHLYAPVTVSCGKALYFNFYKGYCDWPHNVDCGDRVIPKYNDTDIDSDSEETCNCDPSEAPEICARDGSNGVLIAHENCDQYYKCYAGKPNALKCSNNQQYNPIKGWCDLAANVDCGDRIVSNNDDSSENDNPTNAVEICAREGSEGVLVAHEICSQFFKCSHGVPVELQCQSGLLYNPDLKLCDWPSQVNCGDRQQ